MNDQRLPIVEDTTGLSWGYRLWWCMRFLGLSIFGPAEQIPSRDPRERLKIDRARKVLLAHEAQGTRAPDDVIETASIDTED